MVPPACPRPDQAFTPRKALLEAGKLAGIRADAYVRMPGWVGQTREKLRNQVTQPVRRAAAGPPIGRLIGPLRLANTPARPGRRRARRANKSRDKVGRGWCGAGGRGATGCSGSINAIPGAAITVHCPSYFYFPLRNSSDSFLSHSYVCLSPWPPATPRWVIIAGGGWAATGQPRGSPAASPPAAAALLRTYAQNQLAGECIFELWNVSVSLAPSEAGRGS